MQYDDDMALKRREMVAQLARYGITNQRVLDAFFSVRRHLFVDESSRKFAYADCALPVGFGQTISQPFTVAFMTSLLVERCPAGKVLEIGTGSGYQAAILHVLGYRVFTIERIVDLYEMAQRRFDELEIPVRRRLGDGTLGWPEEAPFEGIIVTAGAPGEPHTLVSQLADGGVLIVPVGDMDSQEMTIIRRHGEYTEHEYFNRFAFVPLCGREGWPESDE